MYQKCVNYLRGSVMLRLESATPERVVNLCAAHAIPFWDVQWCGENSFTVRTTRAALPRLRQVTAETDCTITVLRQTGVPLLLQRLRRRYVLLGGLAAFLLLLFGGNLFIWEFRVTGNETVPAETILRELEEYGITVGSVGLRIDQEAMRNHVLLELPDLSWLVVNVKGCVAHVQVVERLRPPQIVQEDEVANVVAARSGLVTKMETLDGEAQVSVGSTVTKGQLLISGVVDSEREGLYLLHGMGNVWARTWYELSVLVPMETLQYVQVEKTITRMWLDLGKKQIKLYAKGSILPPDCGKITHYGAVCLPGGYRLPVTVVREETVRCQAQMTTRTEAEARAEGEAALLELLADQMTEGGTVTDTRFAAARKGNYLLVTLKAECLEQIGQQVVLPRE